MWAPLPTVPLSLATGSRDHPAKPAKPPSSLALVGTLALAVGSGGGRSDPRHHHRTARPGISSSRVERRSAARADEPPPTIRRIGRTTVLTWDGDEADHLLNDVLDKELSEPTP